MKIENFLNQGVKQVRKSIRDIDDSYNNDWDILAELTQNSVDAIRLASINNGNISIIVDSQNQSISIRDNGIGIDPTKLPELLAPFATDKEDNEESIGEKGVGLTFVLFSCNDFYIKSGNSNGTSEGHVTEAHLWKNSSENRELPLIHNELNEEFQGTEVILKKVESPVFNLSFNQLKYVLRTRTSIGNTNIIWDTDIDINITLTYINPDGVEFSEKLPYQYWLPIDNLSNTAKIDIEEFYEYIKKDRTDQEKRTKLKNKIVYKKTIINHNNRSIKAFACFVPKRKTWDDLTISNQIATQEQLENNDWVDKFNYSILNPGIYTSVKGMPTGITVDHPITGAAGAWPQIFIIFEDRYLKFDIGRKSIHGMQARIYKNHSREIFREFQRIAKYFSGEIITEPEWEKEDVFADIEKLLDLNIPGIQLKKTPRDQEASVAGLFFECLGNGKIKDINPLVSGYRNRYDLYAKWGNKKVVIEFKSSLSNILKDFSDETKLFNEINCVVCWDVTEIDEQIFQDKGIDISVIEPNSLPGTTQNYFPSATHRLTLSGFVAPIYVIDMKKVVN
jgi:molecular chaperone HtpG